MTDSCFYLQLEGDDNLIEIPEGKVVIGRGPFLKCTDKRVSRNHAELELTTTGQLYINSQQSIFYCDQNGKGEFQRLEKGSTQLLQAGDSISLLPDNWIFKLVAKPKKEAAMSTPEMSSELKTKLVENSYKEEHETQNNLKLDGSKEIKERKLPDWMMKAADAKPEEKKNAVKKPPKSKETKISNPKTTHKQDEKSVSNDELNADKPNSKKVENKSRLAELHDVSDDSVDSTINNNNSFVRSLCKYGDKCYRKNPEHRKEFCHPDDADYEECVRKSEEAEESDQRPECEYGIDCYRKNPQHRKTYKHTANPKRKAVIKARKRKAAEDAEGGSDEDEFEESFIDDDSDGYDPRKDNADYSSDDEDLETLNAEAKAFTKNRKMFKTP